MMTDFQLFIKPGATPPFHLDISSHIINALTRVRLIFIIGLCVSPMVLMSFAAHATNYFKEYELSNRIINLLPQKEIVWLDTHTKHKTLALFKESEMPKIRGGIILFSDLDQHPDWQVITSPLRQNLASYGWETLSVQAPLFTDKPASFQLDDAYSTISVRITTAINFFKARGVETIVLLANGQAANLSVRFLTEKTSERDIDAIVYISAFDSKMLNVSELMRKLPIAQLDVIAEDDWDNVLNSAERRLVSAKYAGQLIDNPPSLSNTLKVNQLALQKTGNLLYRQIKIYGADHDYNKMEYSLAKGIHGWLMVHIGEKSD